MSCDDMTLPVINEGQDHVQLLKAVTVGVVMDNGSNTFRLESLHNDSAIWPGFI